MLKCPQDEGFAWKLEDNDGVCAQTQPGWVDWEWPDDNAQKSLGFYLDTWNKGHGMIAPVTSGSTNCYIGSSDAWKDTTSLYASGTLGPITVYYSLGSMTGKSYDADI